MNRVVRFTFAVVLIAVSGSASAYQRETTNPAVVNAGGCGGPEPLWWGSRDVTLQINPEGASSTACPLAVDVEAAVSTAVAQWGDANYLGSIETCTDFHFTVGAATSNRAIGYDGMNLVVIRKGLCQGTQTPTHDNCWNHDNTGTIALTTTTSDHDSGQILDADVELFAWDGSNGKYLSCADPATAPSCTGNSGTGCWAVDIVSVMTHESGHVLGLDHVCTPEFGTAFTQCNKDGTIKPIMSPQVGNVAQRTLTPDDVNGVCGIYPKAAATAHCPAVEQPGSSHGGCSSAGGVGVAGLLALLAAARRRRPS
jgi:hypothetical protein